MNHKRLYIGDIGPDVSEAELYDLIAQSGKVVSIEYTKGNSNTQGFALVEVDDPATARACVQRLNGYILKGYALLVYTIPPRSRPRTRTRRP